MGRSVSLKKRLDLSDKDDLVAAALWGGGYVMRDGRILASTDNGEGLPGSRKDFTDALGRRVKALTKERDEALAVLREFVGNKDFIKALCRNQLDYPHMIETFDAAWKLVGGELESPIARTAQPQTESEET
jgi:hypothetical protein